MSSVYSEKLMKWVSGRMADITPDGSFARFELFHVVEGEGAARLHVARISDPTSSDEEEVGLDDAGDVAQLLWDVAHEDSESRDVGLPQRYVVQAFRSGFDEPECTYSFRIAGGAHGDYLAAQGTERPTPQGRQSQEMRHSENLHRMLVQLTEATAVRLSRDLDKERESNEKLRSQLLKTVELQQDLLDRKQDRDLKSAKEVARAQHLDQLLTVVMSLMPLFASKFLAGGLPVGASNLPASSARDVAIGNILKGLDEQEVTKIFTSLKPSNQAAFLELYKSYAEDHQKSQQNKPEILQDGNEKKEEQG